MININIPSGVKQVKDSALEKNEAVEKFLEKIDTTVSEKTSEVLSSIGESVEPMVGLLNATSGVLTKLKILSDLIPIDLTTFPSFNIESIFTGGILNSIKQIALAALLKLKNEANKLKMYVINLGFAALDSLIKAITDSIKDQLVKLIDNTLEEYTGYTKIEVLYLCSQGFQLIDELKKIIETNKQKGEEIKIKSKKELKSAKQQLAEYRQNGRQVIDKTEDDILNSSEKIKDNIGSEVEIKKQQIFNYAKSLSGPLFNAFLLIVIKHCSEDLISKIGEIQASFDPASLLDSLNFSAVITDFLSNNLNIEQAPGLNGDIINERATSINNYLAKNKNGRGKYISISIINKSKGNIKVTFFNDPELPKTQNELLLKMKDLDIFDIASINDIINISKTFYKTGQLEEIKHPSNANDLLYTITFEKKGEDEGEETTELVSNPIEFLANEEIALSTLNTPRPVSKILQQVLRILLKLLPTIEPIATLISNYRTNKEYVRQFAMKNMDVLNKERQKSQGDKEEIDTTGRNCYIIRTQDMFDTFCMVLNKSKLESKDILTVTETNQILRFFSIHCIDSNGLKKDIETILYVHIDGGKDGSFIGTNLNYYSKLNKLIIDNSKFSDISSQIMRCMHRGFKA